MSKLSIIIPARDEEWLKDTLLDILSNIRDDTEILVGLDGWAMSFDMWDSEKIRWYVGTEPIGQRAMQNKLARLAEGQYIMKVDAHCSFSAGFDKAMLDDIDEKTLLVPMLFNLHAFDWICDRCGRREYQGVKPKQCCGKWIKERIWQVKPKPFYSNFFFDKDLVFQYHPVQKPDEVHEVMTIQGSGFMVSKEMYFDLELADEKYGSWGMQGTEVAGKVWLCGGRVLSTKKAFMGHMFRAHEEFPYQRDMKQVDHALAYCKDMFLHNKLPKQTRPLSWLVEKFSPVPTWEGEALDDVRRYGELFNKKQSQHDVNRQTL